MSAYPVTKYAGQFFRQAARPMPSLSSMGFRAVDEPFPSRELKEELLKKYKERRDYPGMAGTSRMGVHLRFGTRSIRELVRRASRSSDTFLNELIWRDFYQMILWHFPQVGQGQVLQAGL